MIAMAKVISVNNDIAKVAIKRVSACGDSCGSCKGGCAPTQTFVEVENKIGAKIGQDVKIEMNTNSFMKTVALIYMFPLFMLILGVVLGTIFYIYTGLTMNQEIFSFLVGLVFLTVSYILLRMLDKRQKKTDKVKFTIIEI